MPTNWEEH